MLLPNRPLIPRVIFLVMLMSPTWCRGADVVFIRSAGGPSQEQRELEVATKYYGLDLKVVLASATQDTDLALSGAAKLDETLAVVIAASTLPEVNERVLLRALRRVSGNSIPVLILGLTPETEPTVLKAWSSGAAVGCKRLESPLELHYAIGRVAGVTGQLAGIDIPFPSKNTFYFIRPQLSEGMEIIKVWDGHRAVPVFIEATANQQRIFLDCTEPLPASDGVAQANDMAVAEAFAEAAPVMMFVKYCAGERGWHALHHYANLTIDDPWLQEPYGFLNYEGLLVEMKKHNFHTTIAFIPWNYDRSEPEVVSLIRKHPEQFSIAIHGDNHDRKEFTDYISKPLAVQVAALRQSVVRMDRFQALTGIPYDKVMIFPHSIAPERTLEALKSQNYLATINSQNVPMGFPRPSGFLFTLRPITILFGGFPSILRYSVAVPTPQYLIAIDAFLDNPLFFYCHHDLFRRGIGAFDNVADETNRLEPDTRWRGLGDIVRHYYLVRVRDDSDYDVLAFSSSIDLENSTGRPSVFYVRRMEPANPAIASVTVDGQSLPFHLHDNYLECNVPIPAGQTRRLVIQYDSSPGYTDVGKRSIRVYLLRKASDFRDNVLSRSWVGRVMIDTYYDNEHAPLCLSCLAIVLIVCCACVGWRIRILIKTGRPR